MIIRDINNRTYIEKTNEKLVLYRTFKKISFKLQDIKYACLNDQCRLKIFYNNKYVDLNVDKRNLEDSDLLIELVESIADRNKICFSTGQTRNGNIAMSLYLIALVSIMILSRNFNNENYLWYIIILYWIITCIVSIRKLNYFEYIFNEGIINVKGGISNKDNIISVKENFKIENRVIMGSSVYVIKVNKKKIVVSDNIISPKSYKEEMKKLYEMKAIT